jgi:hypothetical protein
VLGERGSTYVDDLARNQGWDEKVLFMLYMHLGLYGFTMAEKHKRPLSPKLTVGLMLYGIGGAGKSTLYQTLDVLYGEQHTCVVTDGAQEQFGAATCARLEPRRST